MSFGNSSHVCPKRQQSLGQHGAVLSQHSAWPAQRHCGNRHTLRGADWALSCLSRLADATALWVRVVGGALGEPAVAEAAAAAASSTDGGLAAVDSQPRAAAIAGVCAAAAQGCVSGRADCAAGGEIDIAVGVAGAGVAVAGADLTAAGAHLTAAGAGLTWTGIVAAGAGIAAARGVIAGGDRC